MSMAIATLIGIVFFAYTIRIFERPYWHQSGLLNFSDIGQAIWLVVISMTTVGYGNMYPVTMPGRSIMLVAIIYGAFLLALLIEVIAIGVTLQDKPKDAIVQITIRKRAGSVVYKALRFNALKKKRYEMLENGDEGDYVPTVKETY